MTTSSLQANSRLSQDSASPLGSTTPMTLFMSHMAIMQYVFKDGQVAVFKEGRYATTKKSYIDELNHEVDEGHPFIYIDPAKRTITTEELAPDYEIRKKIREELMLELTSVNRNMGSSDSSGGANTGVASTQNVGQAALGSSDQGVRAAMANMPVVATKAGPVNVGQTTPGVSI